MRKTDKDGLDVSDNDFKDVDDDVTKHQNRLLTASYIAYQCAKGTLNLKDANKDDLEIYRIISKI